MILWIKRVAAVWSGIFLMALLFSSGSPWAGLTGGILNFASWVKVEKFPIFLRRFFSGSVLVINAVGSAYGVLSGGPAAFALLTAGGSLISWNTGLFAGRWPDVPPSIRNRFIRHLGGTIALGLAAGLSALTLQGHFSSNFLSAFSLVLIGPILFLRLISRASQRTGGGFR